MVMKAVNKEFEDYECDLCAYAKLRLQQEDLVTSSININNHHLVHTLSKLYVGLKGKGKNKATKKWRSVNNL